MGNAQMDKSQAGIKITRRYINHLSCAYDPTLIAERKEEEPFDESKEESEEAGIKFNIQKSKIMASGPITSWEIDGKTMKTVRYFIFLSSKITADGDCSHEKTLAPWKKSYDQPTQLIKKQRHYFTNKDLHSQSYVFSSSHAWV